MQTEHIEYENETAEKYKDADNTIATLDEIKNLIKPLPDGAILTIELQPKRGTRWN